ncbi:MAG TPA: hypothetical protein VKP67_23715 [Xanthobacteraceae bacterium]|nr:hypothetical protein [Xanthobacteraceae bacterium]
MTARGAAGGAGGSRSGSAVDAGVGAGTSKRKLRANRLGKPAGTGPTSAAGKARSAQNARKHGLNVPVMYDPEVSADVEFMAEEIAPGSRDSELIGRARRIAEAQVDLMRVARARRDIISAAMADPNCGPVTGRTGHSLPGRGPGEAGDAGADKLVAVLSDMSGRLAKLDWYERVALSRRKRAIRAFDAARRKAARRRRTVRV